MNKKKVFSIIIPVYQNEENIDKTVTSLLTLKGKLPNYKLELIFIDDGSSDNSLELLLKHKKHNKSNMIVIKLTKNFGQISAIQAGLKIANGDCAGIISADLQDPYELFIEMIKKWEIGLKLIIGERIDREESINQSFVSNLYWRLVNKYAVKGYPLGGYDFCLIDRQVIDDINRIDEKNTHIFVLIFSLGYKYEKIYYKRMKRELGKSQWTLPKKIKLFVDTFVSFSYLPVKGISYIGLAISILSFFYAFFIVMSKFIFGNEYEGWTTIIVLISSFSGLILLTLGIIGEYLWRILDETRKRPYFVIDKIYNDDSDVVEK